MADRQDERRIWSRRDDDKERDVKIAQAQGTADKALAEIQKHTAVCEKDNEHIKSTLSKQDRMLNWIVGLIITALAFIAALHIENLGKH